MYAAPVLQCSLFILPVEGVLPDYSRAGIDPNSLLKLIAIIATGSVITLLSE